MSTVTTLIALEAANRLKRFKPRLVGRQAERRKLTLAIDIDAWLVAPVKGNALIRWKAQISTHFAQFVREDRVDDCYFMKRVEDRRNDPFDFSHEVWAVSPRFNPQYRFFGSFATQDWFVILTKQSRQRLDEHENRWHTEIDRVKRTWSALFGSDLPHSGTSLQQYISHNAEHCDERW